VGPIHNPRRGIIQRERLLTKGDLDCLRECWFRQTILISFHKNNRLHIDNKICFLSCKRTKELYFKTTEKSNQITDTNGPTVRADDLNYSWESRRQKINESYCEWLETTDHSLLSLSTREHCRFTTALHTLYCTNIQDIVFYKLGHFYAKIFNSLNVFSLGLNNRAGDHHTLVRYLKRPRTDLGTGSGSNSRYGKDSSGAIRRTEHLVTSTKFLQQTKYEI